MLIYLSISKNLKKLQLLNKKNNNIKNANILIVWNIDISKKISIESLIINLADNKDVKIEVNIFLSKCAEIISCFLGKKVEILQKS